MLDHLLRRERPFYIASHYADNLGSSFSRLLQMFGGMERPPASEVREIADLPEFSWKYEGIFKVVLNGNGSHSDNISTLEVACPKTAAEFRNTDQRKPTNFTLYPEGAVGTVAQLAWH